jgi:glycosyltransferase involved in cell wall biosynthesis
LSGKSVLVPTAERDAAIGLSIFGPVFRNVRAIMYNSPEERAMIQAASGNTHVPGVVVGVGSEVPDRTEPAGFRRKFGLHRPFAIYIGRIDENKGCADLFAYFRRYAATFPRGLDLVLIGNAVMPVPDHPRIHHLGFVSDTDKFDALAASDLLIMPSYYESLSMVALEAWALGRPVVANAHCDVLLGQCMRSNAGLYYRDAAEFTATLEAIVGDPALAATLGHNGRAYYERHYDWPVIERKYLTMFARLDAETAAGAAPRGIAPLPGWWERRRATLPAAADVLAALPGGPALGGQQSHGEYA